MVLATDDEVKRLTTPNVYSSAPISALRSVPSLVSLSKSFATTSAKKTPLLSASDAIIGLMCKFGVALVAAMNCGLDEKDGHKNILRCMGGMCGMAFRPESKSYNMNQDYFTKNKIQTNI